MGSLESYLYGNNVVDSGTPTSEGEREGLRALQGLGRVAKEWHVGLAAGQLLRQGAVLPVAHSNS